MARKKSDTLQGDGAPEPAGEPEAKDDGPGSVPPDAAGVPEPEAEPEVSPEPLSAAHAEPGDPEIVPEEPAATESADVPEPAAPAEEMAEDRDAEATAAEPEVPADAAVDDAAVDTVSEQDERSAEAAREPVPVVDSVEENHEELHEEEAGWSLAGRLLAALCLLVVGAALGIWAAPKIAPALPAGMAPIARWLEPGQAEVEARIAALQARVDDLATVETRVAALPTTDDVDARVGAAVAGAETRLAAEIAAARETAGQVDLTSVNQRLGQLEAGVQSSTTELENLKAQIAGTAGQVSEDTLGRIDAYKGEVEALRGEMGTVRDTVSGFATRLDTAETRASREIEAAQAKVAEVEQKASTETSASAVASDVAQIRAALAAGQPFEQPLAALSAQGTTAPPEGLSAAATSGVATLAALRASYPDAAHAAIRASIMASAGSGVLARARAFVEAQISSRSLTPQTGEGTDAVLSRMEDKLRQDDLDAVLAEANQLPSEAAAAMGNWLGEARKRAAAVDGLATFDASLATTN